jgi:hypothetical protein
MASDERPRFSPFSVLAPPRRSITIPVISPPLLTANLLKPGSAAAVDIGSHVQLA